MFYLLGGGQGLVVYYIIYQLNMIMKHLTNKSQQNVVKIHFGFIYNKIFSQLELYYVDEVWLTRETRLN